MLVLGLKGRHVLIMGVGNSALDCALEAIDGGAASVKVACRHGTMILPVTESILYLLRKY